MAQALIKEEKLKGGVVNFRGTLLDVPIAQSVCSISY